MAASSKTPTHQSKGPQKFKTPLQVSVFPGSSLLSRHTNCEKPSDSTSFHSVLVCHRTSSQGFANIHVTILDENDWTPTYMKETLLLNVIEELDREEYGVPDSALHVVVVGAKDMGVPPRTGTATVSVVIQVINDSPPEFAKDVYC
ncbi:protocadherin Fat 4 [Trichonephila clavipes]|nr:protocadherin Fat 4 [Trichonephila clavipes]